MLYESFIPALAVGGGLLVMLAMFWWITANRWLLVSLIIPIGIIAGGWYLQWKVVTPKESVERSFDTIRQGFINKDMSLVASCLTDDFKSNSMYRRAEDVLRLVNIRKIGIYDLELEFNDFTNPPTAQAEFHCVVKYSMTGSGKDFGGEVYSAHFSVELEQSQKPADLKAKGGKWLVTDHFEYTGGI